MNYVLLGGAAIVGALVLFQVLRTADLRRLARAMRWIVGGGAALLTAYLVLRGQVGIATFSGYAAYLILRTGRLGPLVFEGRTLHDDNESTVRSRYFAMNLDHATGTVAGRVTAGSFRGRDLISLGEDETRRLLSEVAHDADSLALLETWLDRNRAGWREHFEQSAWSDGEAAASAADGPVEDDAVAYEILGLKPGATDAEIRAAHRALMKGVHPDQGGSTFLAARINAAKDRLLRRRRR